MKFNNLLLLFKKTSMKIILALLTFVAMTSFRPHEKSIYDFKIKALDGSTIDFSKYKGKKILIVNTASMCGFTHQYAGLEKLYEDHKNNLVVVGFPSDNFGNQEYHSNDSISSFCKKNFGVTFPLTTRVDVHGPNTTPVFKYLCSKSENGVLDASISWNFNKFIIDEKGNLVKYFDSKIEPESDELLKYIDK